MKFVSTIAAAFMAAGLVTSVYAQNDQSKASPADQAFMKKAAQGNMAEIEAGKLAQTKASSSEIKQFGAKMQQDHGKVLAELQTLATSKGVTLPTETDEKHKALAKKLAASSGKQFDETYAKDAGVADHTEAKQLFETGSNSKDPDVSAFAKKVLPDIEHHLEMAKQLAQKS